MNKKVLENNKGMTGIQIVGTILLIGAGILLGLALLLFFCKKPETEKIDAVITEISYDRHGDEEDNDVYVDYTYDDEEYTHVKNNYYVSTMEEGDTITITIDPETGDITSGAVFYYIGGGVLSFLALLGAFVGILMLILGKKR